MVSFSFLGNAVFFYKNYNFGVQKYFCIVAGSHITNTDKLYKRKNRKTRSSSSIIIFKNENPIVKEFKSNVDYKMNCSDCNQTYVD